MISLLAYAKINLSLSVGKLRTDGFHDVESVVQTIDLADKLVVEVARSGGVRVSNSLGIPPRKDLAWKAARLVLGAKKSSCGIGISIEKRIPVCAGLGGGSSDAAAVLFAVNQLTSPVLSSDTLLDLAVEVGSDVPLFLSGGRLMLSGRGEKIEPLPPDEIREFVLVLPQVSCSTREAYHRLDDIRARSSVRPEGKENKNDLESVALELYPQLKRYKNTLSRIDADVVGMSGSGSTFFAGCVDIEKARSVYENVKCVMDDAEIMVCSSTTSGYLVEGEQMIRIAIDGPAASGKTSLAKALAKVFDCQFLETGMMYRAVALGTKRGLRLEKIQIEIDAAGHLLLNGDDVTDILYTSELDRLSSQVATDPAVRERLVSLQRQIASRRNVVMEGRDIGTVVLPQAEVKIYLEASPEERAERRCKQRNYGDFESTLQDIVLRDGRDSTREISPLNAASDAIIIRTDQKSLAEVISEAAQLVKERLEKS